MQPADLPGLLSAQITAAGAIVPAVAGKRIVVTKLVVSVGTAGTVLFQSSTGPVTVGQSNLAVGVPLALEFDGSGWFQTAIGDALNLAGTGAGPLGWLEYYLG